VFRDPLLPPSRYEDLYRHGGTEVWDGEGERPDFDLVRRHMAADTHGGDVLEIGCYTGSLLHSLPKRYRLHGVELNERAAQIAASRGIEIVAAAAAELPGLSEKFDTIIACDVIEHLENPLDFLGQLRGRLAPGGRVLISTGDSGAWLWRLLRTRFWYCSFPEHISFVGKDWFQAMAGRAGLQVVQQTPFNYSFNSLRPAGVFRLARTLLYGSNPKLYEWLHRRVRGPHAEGFVPPGCGATADHVFCVLAAV